MFFGAHVSISGGIFNAPLNAANIGAEVFQIFTRSPHGGPVQPLTKEIIGLFKQNLEHSGIPSFYVHTPYFINFASNTKRIQYGSVSVVRQELERSSLLGAKYVMTHLGSYKDLGKKSGFDQVVDGLSKVLSGYKGETKLLIENSAGSGEIIGSSFEELAEIVFHPKLKKFDIGFCYDTQHAFASGYDERDKKAVEKTFKNFNELVGLNKIKMFHCNDSMVELGKNTDRHEHIGEGKIGVEGFKNIFTYFKDREVDFILETKHDKVLNDLKTVKLLRSKII